MKNSTVATLALVFSAAMTGCTTPTNGHSSSSGWEAYQAFQRELNRNPENPDYGRHLSDDWIAMFNSADSDDELSELRDFAAYPDWLSETQAHYEKPGDNVRCLSVNGTAFDQAPGTLSVRYVRQGNQLRASEIHYQYWENKEEFPEEAKCPEDFELTFPDS